ncbi:MAG: zinc metallopeptidase [Chloroflexota bacterium]
MPLIVIALIFMLLGMIAQSRVKSVFDKYGKYPLSHGLTGQQIARQILDAHGLQDVLIEEAKFGQLSDHYDPEKRVLRLSQDVSAQSSISAAGVAAHEAGHAIQHAEGYGPLMMRTSMATKIALVTQIMPFLFYGSLLGLFSWRPLAIPLGILTGVVYLVTAGMALVSLPVEFDASDRAKKLLARQKIVNRKEMEGVSAVLNVAAWTYVLAALRALFSRGMRR